jgi:hypothetical protein
MVILIINLSESMVFLLLIKCTLVNANVCSIIYKKETNKWYYKVGKLLNLLDYGKLSIFCSSVGLIMVRIKW